MVTEYLFNKRKYAIGEKVPRSAIYKCSICDDVTAFKKGESFSVCENCPEKNESQQWIRTNEVVHFVSKNLNLEFKRIETIGLKVADFIADYSGRISFVILHIIWFWFWIYVNTGHSLLGITNFDLYPFGLLTMIVSLEAIFLATFILISQNRQGVKSELRAELDYQTNLKTEKEVAELASVIRDIKEDGERMREELRTLSEALVKKPVKKTSRVRRKASETILEEAGIDTLEEK